MAWSVWGRAILAAVFPGTSRSGMTILLCLLLGTDSPGRNRVLFPGRNSDDVGGRRLENIQGLASSSARAVPENWGMVLLAFVVSAIVSFIAVRWLLRYIQTHTFVLFGWYRIALAALIAGMLVAG